MDPVTQHFCQRVTGRSDSKHYYELPSVRQGPRMDGDNWRVLCGTFARYFVQGPTASMFCCGACLEACVETVGGGRVVVTVWQ